MKNILPLIVLPLVFSSAVNADFLRVEAGLGAWNSDPSGTIQYADSVDFDLVDTAGFEAETNAYAWVYFKHFVPVVPNVRLEYANPLFEGTTYDGSSSGIPASVSNELALTQYDAVLYYNLLDNTFWATVDLGLDIKYIDGSYKIEGEVLSSTEAFDQSFSLVTPLLYGRVRAELPFTGLAVEAIAKGMSYSDSTVVDASIKVDYTLDFIPIVQPGIELGYRYQQLKLDASALGIDSNFDTTFSGVYAGVIARF